MHDCDAGGTTARRNRRPQAAVGHAEYLLTVDHLEQVIRPDVDDRVGLALTAAVKWKVVDRNLTQQRRRRRERGFDLPQHRLRIEHHHAAGATGHRQTLVGHVEEAPILRHR